MNLPPHVTIDWLLERCTECPVCGNMTSWKTTNAGKNRAPTIHLHLDGSHKTYYVRRVVWHLTHPTASLPEGRRSVITSRCSNMQCIDPAQVYQASKSAAFQQAARRGSWRSPEALRSNVISGARRSKLSDEAVEDIVSGGDRAVVAAAKHNISETYVHMLRAGHFRRTVTARNNPFAALIR